MSNLVYGCVVTQLVCEAPPPNSNQCPNAPPLQPNECSGERDTCWNTGKQDDCARGFFCCFDGCVKTCYNLETGEFLRHPQSQFQNNNQGPVDVQLVLS